MSESEVITELRECGFHIGAFKDKLDIDAIETRTLVFSDKISWISINLLGTVANVEIREIEQPPSDNIPDYAAANLVAARGGVIEDFKDVRGEVVAKIGDIVGEGDLLVSGLYGDDRSSFRYTCAKGEVLARTTHDFSVEIPLTYTAKRYTGEVKCEKYIIFFEKEVKFTINSGNLPPSCDTIDTVEYLETPWGTRLPVGVRTVRYYEYAENTETRSEESAETLAFYKLRVLMESELAGAELTSKDISGELFGDTYILKCKAECIENIATVKEIEIEGLPPVKRSE
jgi:similar to stage IV sporulation protein